MRIFRPPILIAVAIVTLVASARAAFAAESLPLKVALSVRPAATQMFAGDNKMHVAYEIYLTNFNNTKLRITSLTIKSAGPNGASAFSRVVSGDVLKASFSPVGIGGVASHDPVLDPSEQGIIFVWLDFPSAAKVPTRVVNDLEIEQDGKPDTRQTVDSAAIGIDHKPPVKISSPLRGADWFSPNAPANDSIHRRTVIALGPMLVVPERYAVDWVRLGPDGDSFHGNPADNHSYHAYGAEVHAVTDGRIVAIKDGIPENTPGTNKMAVPITLDTIGGNYIVEALDGGHYAFYAHFIPGSLRVKTGDRVRSGDVLGLLGNSGNSTEPHLHFQIMQGTEFLGSEGLPFEIDHFERRDYEMTMKGETVEKFVPGKSHEMIGQSYMNRDLGDFGK